MTAKMNSSYHKKLAALHTCSHILMEACTHTHTHTHSTSVNRYSLKTSMGKDGRGYWPQFPQVRPCSRAAVRPSCCCWGLASSAAPSSAGFDPLLSRRPLRTHTHTHTNTLITSKLFQPTVTAATVNTARCTTKSTQLMVWTGHCCVMVASFPQGRKSDSLIWVSLSFTPTPPYQTHTLHTHHTHYTPTTRPSTQQSSYSDLK